jgi:hypothetical protein
MAILSVGIGPSQKEGTLASKTRPTPGSAWRDHLGIPGGIISEQVAGSDRNGWRDHVGIRNLATQKKNFADEQRANGPERRGEILGGMAAAAGTGMAAGVAVVAAPEVAAATGRALGPRGHVFGRKYLGGRAIFTGENFRFGWGWNGPKGVQQLRFSGKWIDAIKGEKDAHIDLPLTLDE